MQKRNKMKVGLVFLAAIVAFSSFGWAQTTTQLQDSVAMAVEQEAKEEAPKKKQKTPVYYGGGVGLTFTSSYTRISVEPLIAYKLSPALSVGGRLMYEYVKDKRFSESLNSHNYGLSAFSRYRLVPQLYAHAEFAAINFQQYLTLNTSDRVWVPFLYLGGGYSQQIAPGTWAYAQVVFDVLNDGNSPYKRWAPFWSVGVNVGF